MKNTRQNIDIKKQKAQDTELKKAFQQFCGFLSQRCKRVGGRGTVVRELEFYKNNKNATLPNIFLSYDEVVEAYEHVIERTAPSNIKTFK